MLISAGLGVCCKTLDLTQIYDCIWYDWSCTVYGFMCKKSFHLSTVMYFSSQNLTHPAPVASSCNRTDFMNVLWWLISNISILHPLAPLKSKLHYNSTPIFLGIQCISLNDHPYSFMLQIVKYHSLIFWHGVCSLSSSSCYICFWIVYHITLI